MGSTRTEQNGELHPIFFLITVADVKKALLRTSFKNTVSVSCVLTKI